MNLGYWQSSVIGTILVLIFFTSIFESIENDQTISYAHFPYGKVQEWKNVKDNIKVQFAYFPDKPIIDTFTALNFSMQNLKTGEHIKDFTTRVVLSYDVASLSNLPRSSLMAVLKDVKSFSNFGLMAIIGVSNSNNSLV